jgi:hypothetical protein
MYESRRTMIARELSGHILNKVIVPAKVK